MQAVAVVSLGRIVIHNNGLLALGPQRFNTADCAPIELHTVEWQLLTQKQHCKINCMFKKKNRSSLANFPGWQAKAEAGDFAGSDVTALGTSHGGGTLKSCF